MGLQSLGDIVTADRIREARAAPFKARIAELEEENRKLRSMLDCMIRAAEQSLAANRDKDKS